MEEDDVDKAISRVSAVVKKPNKGLTKKDSFSGEPEKSPSNEQQQATPDNDDSDGSISMDIASSSDQTESTLFGKISAVSQGELWNFGIQNPPFEKSVASALEKVREYRDSNLAELLDAPLSLHGQSSSSNGAEPQIPITSAIHSNVAQGTVNGDIVNSGVVGQSHLDRHLVHTTIQPATQPSSNAFAPHINNNNPLFKYMPQPKQLPQSGTQHSMDQATTGEKLDSLLPRSAQAATQPHATLDRKQAQILEQIQKEANRQLTERDEVNNIRPLQISSAVSNLPQLPPRPSTQEQQPPHQEADQQESPLLPAAVPYISMRLEDFNKTATGVRCMACGSAQHTIETCPDRICSSCGKRDSHWTEHCDMPRSANTCGFCRQQGHRELVCPLRNSNSTFCKLCRGTGHDSENCTTFFRAYHIPPFSSSLSSSTTTIPKPPFMAKNETKIQCYTCTSNKHYGDDCPKNPKRNKGVFSAEFANLYIQPLLSDSTNESQRGDYDIDDDDDDNVIPVKPVPGSKRKREEGVSFGGRR